MIPSLLRRAACAGALVLGFGATRPAHAGNFVVTNTNDSGVGSLRQAILDANNTTGSDSISFEKPTFDTPQTIALTSGELAIANSGELFISGQGADKITISGNNSSRIFKLLPFSRVTMRGFTLARGRSNGEILEKNGGAIYNDRSNLTLSAVTFSANTTAAGGSGGAIYNIEGTLNITDCTFANNASSLLLDSTNTSASGDGGGAIYNSSNGTANGTATITNSSFSSNSSGGAVGGAIASDSNCTLTVRRSNFSSNTSQSNDSSFKGTGGAIFNRGRLTVDSSTFFDNSIGAIHNRGSESSSITNSTLAGNSGGAIRNSGTLSIESCTIAQNIGSLGSGITNDSGGSLILNNSIVALNGYDSTSNHNIYGAVTGGDYNLVDDTTNATLTGIHNITGRNPQLRPLAFNGGPTRTYALLPGSPAIDAGKSLLGLSTDQRGGARPRDLAGVPNAQNGNGSDIGAFEYEAPQSGSDLAVNTIDDHDDGVCGPSDCTLREAMLVAESDPDDSTITFAPAPFASRQTLTLYVELPAITTPMTITGPSTLGAGVTLAMGDNSQSVLYLQGGSLNLSNVTLVNGYQGIRGFGKALTVNACTFIDCLVGILNGGDPTVASNLTVNNSTFVGSREAALKNMGNPGSPNVNTATLNSCTLANNGTGILIDGGVVNLLNSLVVGNTTANISNANGGTLNSDHSITTGTSAQAGLDPNGLGYANGGPTRTIALVAGSPAIDAGNTTLSLDQRGRPRPADFAAIANAPGSNGSDIGAFEWNEEAQYGLALAVNTTDDHDDGVCGPTDCTLREAINYANTPEGPNAIYFAPQPFDNQKTTITLKSDAPVIGEGVGITGPYTPGAGLTIENPNTTSGNALRIEGGGGYFSSLTLKGYNALFVNSTGNRSTTIAQCAIVGSNVGVTDYGNLSLINCTITGSQSEGLLHVTGTSSLTNCTIAGNANGITFPAGTVQLSNTLVVGNGTNLRGSGSILDFGSSITTGTAASAGLNPAGLKDNGGPTPTIALVEGSPAINAGNSSIPTDQRGVKRDSKADIGAYEFINTAPSLVSLSPQNESDKVGAKRTFTFTASDAEGARDIKEMWLLINERLSWNAGATLIYVPSASSPTSGLLYLRRGDAFLPPMQIGEGASATAVLDSGAVRVAASEVKITTEGNSLTLSLPLTIRDGLIGQNRVFARVVDGVGALDPTAQTGDDGYRRFGTYTVTPQFSGGTNSAPTLSRLTPGATSTTLNSSGVAPAVQTFSFAVKDENGSGDLESLWFLAGKVRNWTGSATFIYQPRSRRLYLRSDDGNSFLGGGVIGTPGILENSQVKVDLSQVKTTIYPDGKTVGLSLPLQAKRGLLGQNKVWLRAQDNQGATAPNGDAQGYVLSGTWNVTQPMAPNSATSLSAGNS